MIYGKAKCRKNKSIIIFHFILVYIYIGVCVCVCVKPIFVTQWPVQHQIRVKVILRDNRIPNILSRLVPKSRKSLLLYKGQWEPKSL